MLLNLSISPKGIFLCQVLISEPNPCDNVWLIVLINFTLSKILNGKVLILFLFSSVSTDAASNNDMTSITNQLQIVKYLISMQLYLSHTSVDEKNFCS